MITPVSIYLAGPIDGIPLEDALGWRDEIAELYPTTLFYNPVTAYRNASQGTMSGVERFNRVAICLCDGVLANLAGPGMGFGTIREIEYASQNPSANKPVAVAGDIQSMAVADLIVRPTVEEALEELLALVADGRHAMSQHPLAQLFSRIEEGDDD